MNGAAQADLGSTAYSPHLALTRLCAIGFLAYSSYAICRTPMLPLLARELGADAPTIGFIVAASTLTGIFVKLPAGAWSDVLGRKPLLVLGTAVFAVMPFSYLAIGTLGALAAVRFVHGSATGVFGPVASASLSDIAPVQRRGAWLSTYSTVQGTGQALGPVIGGYLIASGRYDLAFLVAGAVAAVTPFLAIRWPGVLPPVRSRQPFAEFARAVRDVGRHPLILITSLAQAAQFVLNGTLNAFLPLFARDALAMSAAEVGWLFALQTVTTLAIRPMMGALSDRVGRRGVIVTGLSVCGGAVLMVSFASSAVALGIAIFIYAVGVAVTTASASAFITDLSQRAHYGAAHGVFGTIYDVGDALGPIAAGVLVASIGYARMFQVMAAVALTGAVVFYAASRRAARPLREAELPVL